MKIIDIGKCIDNVDPLGIGRIRVIRYNEYVGQKEKAIDYEPWSDKDLFIASPFLPNNVNFIPEINQSVKIISYNTTKDTVNVEYIAGPFTTMYDYNGQTFDQQIANTTYGVNVKHKPAIRNNIGGKYINNKSENTFAKERDFAIYGKNNSDILFTENGLQLRSGKLLSKEAASNSNREILLDYPIMAKKSSRLYLKKFPKKMTLEEVVVKNTVKEDKDIKYIIEYEVYKEGGLKNITDQYPATINLFVYKVIHPYGDEFKTNYFTEHSVPTQSLIKLINPDNSSSTPTYTTTVNSLNDVYKEIRDNIFLLHEKGLWELGQNYQSSQYLEDMHPFYFRPTLKFKGEILLTQEERDNRQTILNNVNVLRIGPSNGLIWSETKAKVESKEVESIEKVVKIDPNTPEQTFGTIISDKFYILSTDLGQNESNNPIPFFDLNQYELSQEDYIKRIEPSTFSTVRGENLLKLLNKMVEVIFTHRHNPLMSIDGQYDYKEGNQLKDLVKTVEDDILNKSIRIN
jgi:hypothetical protein